MITSEQAIAIQNFIAHQTWYRGEMGCVTTRANISTYGNLGAGFYFTTDREIAEEYAGYGLFQATLKFQKPLLCLYQEPEFTSELYAEKGVIDAFGRELFDQWVQTSDEAGEIGFGSGLTRALIEKGYDSIVCAFFADPSNPASLVSCEICMLHMTDICNFQPVN